jgi:hypothetical protein
VEAIGQIQASDVLSPGKKLGAQREVGWFWAPERWEIFGGDENLLALIGFVHRNIQPVA